MTWMDEHDDEEDDDHDPTEITLDMISPYIFTRARLPQPHIYLHATINHLIRDPGRLPTPSKMLDLSRHSLFEQFNSTNAEF